MTCDCTSADYLKLCDRQQRGELHIVSVENNTGRRFKIPRTGLWRVIWFETPKKQLEIFTTEEPHA